MSNGFGTVVVGELFVPRIGVGGDNDDGRVCGVALTQPVEHGEATAAGHDQVENHEVGCVPFGPNQRLGSVPGLQHPVPVVLEGRGDHLEDRLVVVDQQHAKSCRVVHAARLAPQPAGDWVH